MHLSLQRLLLLSEACAIPDTVYYVDPHGNIVVLLVTLFLLSDVHIL